MYYLFLMPQVDSGHREYTLHVHIQLRLLVNDGQVRHNPIPTTPTQTCTRSASSFKSKLHPPHSCRRFIRASLLMIIRLLDTWDDHRVPHANSVDNNITRRMRSVKIGQDPTLPFPQITPFIFLCSATRLILTCVPIEFMS